MQNLDRRNKNQTSKQRTKRMRMKVQLKKQKLLHSQRGQVQFINIPNTQNLSKQKNQQQKRKMQNRQSAKASRIKKKKYIQLRQKQINNYKVILSKCPVFKFNIQQLDINTVSNEIRKQSSFEIKKSSRGRKNEQGKNQQQLEKQRRKRKTIQKQKNKASAQESRVRQIQRKQALDEQSHRLKQYIESCLICRSQMIKIKILQSEDVQSDSSQVLMVQNGEQQIMNPQAQQQNQWQRMRLDQESSIWKGTIFGGILLVTIVAIYFRGSTVITSQDERGRFLTYSTNHSQTNNQSHQALHNLTAYNSTILSQPNQIQFIDAQLTDHCRTSLNQHKQILISLEHQQKLLDKQRQKYCSKEYPQLCVLNECKRIRLLRYEYWSRDIAEKKCNSDTGQLSQVDKLYFASIMQDIQVQLDRNFKTFINEVSSTGILNQAYKKFIYGALIVKMYKNQLSQSVKTYNYSHPLKNQPDNQLNSTSIKDLKQL